MLESGRDMNRLLCCTCAALTFAAAASAQKVTIDYDKSQPLGGLHRYQWRMHQVFEKNPALLEKYAVGIELIKQFTNEEMTKKGFQSVSSSPDFFVTFVIGTRNKEETIVTSSGPMMYGWYGWSPAYAPMWTESMTRQYTEGTLILDMVRADSSQLAWRAYCWSDIRDAKERHKNIQKAIKKALKDFPPKP